MAKMVHRLVLFFFTVLALPTEAQEMEHPPPPKAAPRVAVTGMSLPAPGGIMIFGATGGLGIEVARALVEQGTKVTAMVRPTSDASALVDMGVTLIEGDALSLDDVTRALSTSPLRAVISALGGRRGDYRVDIGGNKNVIDATRQLGIPRLVLVTAIGAGHGGPAAPWYIKYFVKEYFQAKTAAEITLQKSGLDYTIVRPGWLLNGEPTGTAKLSDAPEAFSWITRADLGRLIVSSIKDEATYNKALTAFDAELTSIFSVFR